MEDKLNEIENEVLNETSEKKVVKVMKASSQPTKLETEPKKSVDPSNFLKELDIECEFCKKEVTVAKYKTLCPNCGKRLDANELLALFKEEEEAIVEKLRQQKKTGKVIPNETKVAKKVTGSKPNINISKSPVKTNIGNKSKNGSLVIKSDAALRGNISSNSPTKKGSNIKPLTIIAIVGVVIVLIVIASIFIGYMQMAGAMSDAIMNNPNIQAELYK